MENDPEQNQTEKPDFEKLIAEHGELGLAAALMKFDKTRGTIYDDLTGIAERIQSIVRGEDVGKVNIESVAEQFGDILTSMAKDGSTIDEIVEMAINMFALDERERIDLMNMVFDKDNDDDDTTDFTAYERSQLEEGFNGIVQMAEGVEDAISMFADFYAHNIAGDIEQFINRLVYVHANGNHDHSSAKGQSLEIKKDIKEHVTDIAKIALGVTIALAADRLIRRKA